MKKIIVVLLAVIALFGLAACKGEEVVNDTEITAEFSDESVNQNSITIDLTVNDPAYEITGTIYARLYDTSNNPISSRSFTRLTTGEIALDGVTITFAGLGLEKSYYIEVIATVGRDTVVVEKFSFQTIGTIHITTVEEFLQMSTYRGADYILDNDLDFSGVEYITPFSSSYFSGTFDGQGYTLSNINIKTSKSSTDPDNNYYYIGILGYLSSSAEVSNLVLDNVTIGSEAEPQLLKNNAKIGFLSGYVASANVKIENVTVQNSYMYLESSTESYVILGGLVGDLKGEISQSSLVNSHISLTTTGVQSDGKYLVRMGGAVGYLQPDAELHEIKAEVDLAYETNITEFAENDGLKVAIGGVVGDNNAINSSDSVTDIVSVGDVTVHVGLHLSEAVYGNYALYVGGLIGYSSTEVTNGFYLGSITVDHLTANQDDDVNKKFYVGSLFGYYGIQKVNEQLVWVSQSDAITISAGDDVSLFADSLIGFEPKTPLHIYGVLGTEQVLINTVQQALTAPVIDDITDYFTSDFVNQRYTDLNN